MGVDPVATPPRRAVFLDRDGVLVEALVRDGRPYPAASPDEARFVDEADEPLRLLAAAGFLLLVVTNQPDVARGTTSREAVDALNARLRERFPALLDVLVCPHDAADDCSCRKPRPGMLLAAAAAHAIDLGASYLVGDRWRDVEAGHAAGCTTVLVDRGYAERGPSVPPHARALSTAEALAWVLADAAARAAERGRA